MSKSAAPWGADPRLARLRDLAGTDPSTWPTRERILYEAAALIASKGYHGATTRDIAEAVGIQQPSIFNHFASKPAIVDELFVYDQVMPAERAAALLLEGGSPAAQLYRYVEWQTRWYQEIPFDLRGLREEQIEELDLARPRRALHSWRRTLNRMVRDGIEAGQFYPDGHDFLYSAINALAFEAVRIVYIDSSTPARLPRSAASFVLRATLRDASTLPAVRREAQALSGRAGPFG